MQEDNPVPTPAITSQVVVEQPKQNNFLTILLSVLLLLSVSIAGFFAFQTQNLVKELTMLKSEKKVVTVATTEPVDTTNWKTYTNTDFSFKYPSNYSFYQLDGGFDIVSPLLPPAEKGYSLRDGELKVGFSFYPTKENDSLEKYVNESKPAYESDILSKEKTTLFKEEAIHLVVLDEDQYFLIHKNLRIRIVKSPVKTTRNSEFDQILSTFKFTN